MLWWSAGHLFYGNFDDVEVSIRRYDFEVHLKSGAGSLLSR